MSTRCICEETKKKPTWEVRLFEYFGPLGLGEEQHLIQSFEILDLNKNLDAWGGRGFQKSNG